MKIELCFYSTLLVRIDSNSNVKAVTIKANQHDSY